MWDELARGAIGAVVLVDTRRIDACFAAIDFFEKRGTPFVVAVNTFDGQRTARVGSGPGSHSRSAPRSRSSIATPGSGSMCSGCWRRWSSTP